MSLFDMDSIMGKLAENPAIQKVIEQVTEVCNGVVLAMTHFDQRFDTIENLHRIDSAKLDRVLFAISNPSQISPAADDGLMGLLADGGEEMIMQEVEPMPEALPDGSNRIKLIQ